MKIPGSPRPFCLAISLILVGSAAPPARGQVLGPEFEVNSYTTNAQLYPAVAADDAGNFVVVWESNLQDGSARGVFGRRFNSAGIPQGDDFQVNSFTTGIQYKPAVTANAAGSFVVVWQSLNQDGAGTGLFGQRFDPVGSPMGGEFQVNSYTPSAQSWPAAAADGLGNVVVVWQSSGQDGAGQGVFGQRFDPAGSPLGAEFQVNSYTTFDQGAAAVAADAAGNFVVVWASDLQDASSFGIFGQRFDATGSPAGSEFQVNSFTTNSQIWPAVAKNSAGHFVVAWRSLGQDGSDFGVFGQRFDAAGQPLGGEFQVNSYTTNNQTYPRVAADDTGNFVVVWSSYDGQDGSLDGVFGQRFDAAGSPLGSELQINSHTTGLQFSPAVAADGAGNFVIAWSSSGGQDGSSYGVFGQRLSAATAIFRDGFDLADACAWTTTVGGGCP